MLRHQCWFYCEMSFNMRYLLHLNCGPGGIKKLANTN